MVLEEGLDYYVLDDGEGVHDCECKFYSVNQDYLCYEAELEMQ
jgi:hypothetical protein